MNQLAPCSFRHGRCVEHQAPAAFLLDYQSQGWICASVVRTLVDHYNSRPSPPSLVEMPEEMRVDLESRGPTGANYLAGCLDMELEKWNERLSESRGEPGSKCESNFCQALRLGAFLIRQLDACAKAGR